MDGIYIDKGSPALAREAWLDMPVHARTFALHDVAEAHRVVALQLCLQKATACAWVREGGHITALAWFEAVCRDSDTASMHLLFALPSTLQNLKRAMRMQPFSTVLALVPAPYVNILRLAQAAGFTRLTTLRKAAWLAHYRKTTNVALMVYKK